MLVVIRRAQCNQPKPKSLLKNVGRDMEGTDLKGDIDAVVDKGDAKDPTCTKGHKHKWSDKENSGSQTYKTSKVSICTCLRMTHLQSVF